MTNTVAPKKNTAKCIYFNPNDTVSAASQFAPEKKTRTRHSLTTSDGRPVPKAAEAITKIEDVNAVQDYFAQRGEWRNLLLFTVGISTAFRCSDILELTFGDFFNADGSYKSRIEKIEMKTQKYREMAITPQIKRVMDKYLEGFKDFRILPNGMVNPDDYVFQSQRIGNNKLTYSSYYTILKDAFAALNLPYHVGTHTMRKTFSYWFLQTHKDDVTALAALQRLLNHSSEKITLAYCGITKFETEKMASDVSSLWVREI